MLLFSILALESGVEKTHPSAVHPRQNRQCVRLERPTQDCLEEGVAALRVEVRKAQCSEGVSVELQKERRETAIDARVQEPVADDFEHLWRRF